MAKIMFRMCKTEEATRLSIIYIYTLNVGCIKCIHIWRVEGFVYLFVCDCGLDPDYAICSTQL